MSFPIPEAASIEFNVVVPSILVEREPGFARIILNRPERINAIDDSIRIDLPRVLRLLDGDPDVRAIVIRGAGTRGFCAGADIKEVRPLETPIEAHSRLNADPWIDAFLHLSTPTIAAIHGACMGGGLEIALACDIRMASADALFALPETGLGLIPGAGGTQRLPNLIGIGPALDMMLSNDRIDAHEAKRLNLITRLHPSSGVLFLEADRLAQSIAGKPVAATRFVRRAALASSEMGLQSGLAIERNLFALLLTTDERIEAAAAFKSRTVSQPPP